MVNTQSQPIGIFDSGLGGLSITKTIIDLLPQESIIYFGDTAHLPYGDKSAVTIQGYATKIVDLLLHKNCKLILIACSSASAAAYELIKNKVGSKALVVNAIDPVIVYIGDNYRNQTIGLIGTRQTIKSNVYQQKIAALKQNITLNALATPLLVPIIEEGFIEHPIMESALREYLFHPNLQNTQALILSCTHYPIIKDKVVKFYSTGTIIEPNHIVAQQVKSILERHNLCNRSLQSTMIPSRIFYVSDYTEAFAKNTQLFFQEPVNLVQYKLL